MSPATRAKFATYCGMTCLGGSERKQCPCARPTDCEMQDHPHYLEARKEAQVRMGRYVVNGLREERKTSGCGDPVLDELLRKAQEAFDALTPEEKKTHRREQMISWVKAYDEKYGK